MKKGNKMTFENITDNAVLNAAGRLVDPGKKINMPVEYYAEHKDFVDGYVKDKRAKIDGLDEYKAFLSSDKKPKEEKEEKVDLMEEVIAEQEEEKAEEKRESQDNIKEGSIDKPQPKKTSRRRRSVKKEEE